MFVVIFIVAYYDSFISLQFSLNFPHIPIQQSSPKQSRIFRNYKQICRQEIIFCIAFCPHPLHWPEASSLFLSLLLLPILLLPLHWPETISFFLSLLLHLLLLSLLLFPLTGQGPVTLPISYCKEWNTLLGGKP